MRINKKVCTMLVLAAALAGTQTMVCMAASKKKIETIRVNFEDNITRGGPIEVDEVEFTSSADQYAITEWEFENESLTWEAKDIPKVTVRFETTDDNYFSVSKNKITVKGDDATVYATKKENSQTLLVTFTLTPISKRVGTIDEAELHERTATWSPADGALSYEVYLFRDARPVGSKKVTTATSYDFGTAMQKDGEYYFRVRGIGVEGSTPGIFLDSETNYYSANSAGETQQKVNNSEISAGTWQADVNGFWWKRQNGTWPANAWELIDNKWYLFNEGGYRVNGWSCWNGLWYYLGPEGDMWVSRQTPEGYMVDANGVMVIQ